MIVVDVNVLAYLTIEGQRTEAARRVLTRDPDWRVPCFWRTEFLNLLSNYVRFKGMSIERALDLWERASKLSCLQEHKVVEEEAFSVAVRRGISLYDALYVALAGSLGTVLVTGDKGLCRGIPVAVYLEEYARADLS